MVMAVEVMDVKYMEMIFLLHVMMVYICRYGMLKTYIFCSKNLCLFYIIVHCFCMYFLNRYMDYYMFYWWKYKWKWNDGYAKWIWWMCKDGYGRHDGASHFFLKILALDFLCVFYFFLLIFIVNYKSCLSFCSFSVFELWKYQHFCLLFNAF